MNTQTLAQRRAKHALERIQKRIGTSYGNYVSYASALPATILMNGLGQAAATLLSKAASDEKDANRLLYDDLQDWMEKIGILKNEKTNERFSLIDAITISDQDKYLRAQAEALAYLVWLKKFANAFLDQQQGGAE